jgi:hypothetical protein
MGVGPTEAKAIENRPNAASYPAYLEGEVGGAMIRTVVGGPYPFPCRTVPPAVQLRASDNPSCWCYINKCTQNTDITDITQRGLRVQYDSSLVGPERQHGSTTE